MVIEAFALSMMDAGGGQMRDPLHSQKEDYQGAAFLSCPGQRENAALKKVAGVPIMKI
jgi:hypothetical protein